MFSLCWYGTGRDEAPLHHCRPRNKNKTKSKMDELWHFSVAVKGGRRTAEPELASPCEKSLKSLHAALIFQSAAFPTRNAAISSYQREKKKSTQLFPLTLLSPLPLSHFSTPAPFFRSDPFSIVPSSFTALAAAIQRVGKAAEG